MTNPQRIKQVLVCEGQLSQRSMPLVLDALGLGAKSTFGDARGSRERYANPNGSDNDIVGIYSKDANVLGLMPHPENLIDPLAGGTDGRGLFESVAGFTKAA